MSGHHHARGLHTARWGFQPLVWEQKELEGFLSAALAITPMTTSVLEDAYPAVVLWPRGRVCALLARLERRVRVRGLRFGTGVVLRAATATAPRSRPPQYQGSR